MGAEEEGSSFLRRENDLDLSDLGRPDTLRCNLLSFVINEEYERAIKTLKDFLASESDYPNFKNKIERYSLHAIDLIYAIRTKRNFPGINALTRTKQQELKEKFREHFNELKSILRKIENCMEELRLNDVKSTRILVNALAAAANASSQSDHWLTGNSIAIVWPRVGFVGEKTADCELARHWPLIRTC